MTTTTASFLQDIFELKCVLKNINVKSCCRIENGEKKLLAILNDEGDILLHYTYGDLRSVLKRIPWYTELSKAIQALCFDPTATWLLTVSLDGSVHIIPALSLVDKNQKVDCKWSVTDVTSFPKPSITPECRPLCAVWWQTLDSNQNALLGYENGAIVLISLTDGRCLGMCSVNEAVKELYMCHDDNFESIFLLITTSSGLQYRLVLEQRTLGYLWPPDITQSPPNSLASPPPHRSRLHSLRQLGITSLTNIRHRLTDTQQPQLRRASLDSGETDYAQPERLPHLSDTWFAPQHARGRGWFGVFYKPTSLFTVHATDIESAPLYIHKLPLRTHAVLLSDRLIYAVNEDLDTLSVISAQFSECRLEGESEFNSEALIAQFKVCTADEKILNIFKLTDTTIIKNKKCKDDHKKGSKAYALPKTVDELNPARAKIDTCFLVTNKSVHRLIISVSPVKKFVDLVNNSQDFATAEKLAKVFTMNLQQLFEFCGDLLLANGTYHQGLVLYKQARAHLLKRVLKLAITADCRTLLKFINLCLTNSKVDMSMATKLHIGNLAVMAYTELLLRYGGYQRNTNTKDFIAFLCHEEFYDQILAVNVACQAGHWHIVNVLSTARGLQPEVLAALAQVIQTSRTLRPNDYDFLLALSDRGLAQSILIYPQAGSVLCAYVRRHVKSFDAALLKRFAAQLDPAQPAMQSMVILRQYHHNRQRGNNTPIESTLDSSYDGDALAPDSAAIVRDVVETYILVLLCLIEKTGDKNYNANLLDLHTPPSPPISPPQSPLAETHIPLPSVRPLSCGWEHTALVRNGSIYCVGVSRAGCLGAGPLLAHSSPAKPVHVLQELRIKGISVACGRMHTVALTDHGIYGWGGNGHGQLGVGARTLESPYPQLVIALAGVQIVDIVAGQYHTVALSISGRLYTWGWGIHGQLGHNACDNEYIPRLLKFEKRIVQIAAGYAHTIILAENGQLYGFGSNLFGQLEHCKIDGANKISHPVLIENDKISKIEKISSGYFHNIAVCWDKVHVWGANPQEVRSCQARYSQRLSCFIPPPPSDSDSDSAPPSDDSSTATTKLAPMSTYEPWRDYVTVLRRIEASRAARVSVEDVAIGYRHAALLSNGRLMWGRSRDGELGAPRVVDETSVPNMFGQKYVHVSCGGDYIMAMEQNGKVFAWGSNTMAQTLLGGSKLSSSSSDMMATDGKVAILKTTRRIIKLPQQNATMLNGTNHSSGDGGNGGPIELSGVPTLAITFATTDARLIDRKMHTVEKTAEVGGVKMLHRVLERWFGLYNSEFVLSKCLEMRQTQACSKLALLSLQYSDSLTYQLTAFSEYINAYQLNFSPTTSKCGDVASILPSASSSSLDSLRHFGDEPEHQGGRESPCRFTPNIGDNVRDYLQNFNTDEQVFRCVEQNLVIDVESAVEGLKADGKTKELIIMAARIVEFYIEQTYTTENPILMQNILMKCLEFWLCNNLPVDILEVVLLKNMDKYFYPLSLLLFCKNFNNNLGEEIGETSEDSTIKDKNSAGGFLKEFSTKFCLHLCSMVLENVNKT